MGARINIVTTVDAVVSGVSEAIYRLDFKPGQQITEAELTERYGVSRNTIREAVARLAVNGLLEKETHRGLFVRALTPDDVRDVYRTRAVLEIDAVRRICENGAVPGNLFELMEKIEQAKWQENWYESVNADVMFHTGVVSASGSSRLLHLYQILGPEIKLCLYQSKLTLLPDPVNRYKHRDLVAALERGDAEGACELVRRHIESGCKNVLQGFPAETGGPAQK